MTEKNSKLEEIKKRRPEIDLSNALYAKEVFHYLDYLISRCEKLEAFVNNFVGADRVELAIWEKGRLSVMNFDPKSLAEDVMKETLK